MFCVAAAAGPAAYAREAAGASDSGAAQDAAPSSLFEDIVRRARDLSRRPYTPPRADLPAALLDMSYDQYRSIRFRPEASLWRGNSRFEVQLFHPGFLFREPVKVHLVKGDEPSELGFDARMFRYDNEAAPLEEHVRENLGYAGFRVHYPLNEPDVMDEVIVFQGASYFRLIGAGQLYGLSARGLAVDTASPSGEEFPAFREFWLVQPAPEAKTMTLYALMDSPSVTGAYRFELTPGASTHLTVDARIFARTDVGKVGIAPLTSMFHHSGSTTRHVDDYRPRVHDSNGLLTQTSAGEWVWRPLKNPRALRTTALVDENPEGFGLVQREREFEGYLDLEANYHRRPSYWVEPLGDWGAGHVELVEIPTDSETNDNIVAYWVDEEGFAAGDSRRFRYRLSTFDDRLPEQTLAQVTRTRIGWGAVPGVPNPPPRSVRQFIVDFAGEDLEGLDEASAIEPELIASSGKITDLTAHRLPGTGRWRVAFKLAPENTQPSDMRLFLMLDGKRLTETWSYVWYPDELET